MRRSSLFDRGRRGANQSVDILRTFVLADGVATEPGSVVRRLPQVAISRSNNRHAADVPPRDLIQANEAYWWTRANVLERLGAEEAVMDGNQSSELTSDICHRTAWVGLFISSPLPLDPTPWTGTVFWRG